MLLSKCTICYFVPVPTEGIILLTRCCQATIVGLNQQLNSNGNRLDRSRARYNQWRGNKVSGRHAGFFEIYESLRGLRRDRPAKVCCTGSIVYLSRSGGFRQEFTGMLAKHPPGLLSVMPIHIATNDEVAITSTSAEAQIDTQCLILRECRERNPVGKNSLHLPWDCVVRVAAPLDMS